MEEKKPYVVVVWGDSIAASGWPQQAEFLFNVVLNTGRPIRVINAGAGGLAAAIAHGQFSETILPHQPNLEIMQFGLNDMRHDGSRGELPISTPKEFDEHLMAMVKLCRERAGARVIIFGNHQTRCFLSLPTGLKYDETRAHYNMLARKVAKKTDSTHYDMAEVLAAVGLRVEEVVGDDGVHLTPRGIQAYAQIAANAIMKVMNLG
jgi:lysophospholipase L1-like esterase